MAGNLQLLGVVGGVPVFSNLVTDKRGDELGACSGLGYIDLRSKTAAFALGGAPVTTDGCAPYLELGSAPCQLVGYERVWPEAAFIQVRDIFVLDPERMRISFAERAEPGVMITMRGCLEDLARLTIKQAHGGVEIDRVRGWSYVPGEPSFEKPGWDNRGYYLIQPAEVPRERRIEITILAAQSVSRSVCWEVQRCLCGK